ncbi:MAG: hypothetical protein HQ581_06565 [Planctomycetes bacterium]|nr:hypothetical protein [Planctomycetota bacterium]
MNTSLDDGQAPLRRGIYTILIVLAAGAMIGRIMAVDSVDRKKLQDYFEKQSAKELDALRARLERGKATPERTEAELAQKRAGLERRSQQMRPFLSGNDRSRWCTVRALVEEEMQVEGAPYAIDKVIQQPKWDTIDMVQHDGHVYSSKPPLFPTLLAGEYWVIHRLTGITLASHPYYVGRLMLVLNNVGAMVIGLLVLSWLVERLGTTDWGRIFAMAAAAFATFLTTFGVVINNHLPAAACAAIFLYAAVRIWCDDSRRWRYFLLAGFFGAFLVSNELPAMALFAPASLVLLVKRPKQTLLAYAPAAAIVAVAFFGTNWIAHESLRPAYAHREDCPQATSREAVQQAVDQTLREAGDPTDVAAVAKEAQAAFAEMIAEVYQRAIEQDREMVMPTLFIETVDGTVKATAEAKDREDVLQGIHQGIAAAAQDAAASTEPGKADPKLAEKAGRNVLDATSQADNPENWYDYSYHREFDGRTIGSYWRNPEGVDQGESCRGVYALHVLIGHHGIFSLSPVWILSVAGALFWIFQRRDRRLRELALAIGAVSAVCLVFFLMRPARDCNYGGMTSGFRWMFWFAPLWTVTMLPAADAMSRRRWTRALALILLATSAISVAYPTWNPWTQPWLMDYFESLGWI